LYRTVATIASIVFLFVFASSAYAGTTTVYPTGSFPADVLSVRSAFAGGGTVLLKATDAAGVPTAFNFGQTGAASLATEADIGGETVGAATTTIAGGLIPFRQAGRVQARIHGITFDRPRGAGIYVGSSIGTAITGNTIRDVQPFLGLIDPYATTTVGIWAGGPGVSGVLTITGNTVSGTRGQIGYGILVSETNGTTNIVSNVVSGSTSTSILTGRKNTVVCDNPYADGILLLGRGFVPNAPENAAVVEGNDVTMHDSYFGAISLYDQASDNLVRANKISGTGAYGLQVANYWPFPAQYTAASNSFAGNNLSGFASSVADVFLDTNASGTIVKGSTGTVVDLGVGNWISGLTHGPPPSLGDRMSAAQAVRHRVDLATASAAPVLVTE
jgi:hypothetical protein